LAAIFMFESFFAETGFAGTADFALALATTLFFEPLNEDFLWVAMTGFLSFRVFGLTPRACSGARHLPSEAELWSSQFAAKNQRFTRKQPDAGHRQNSWWVKN
jgi:hypothetical protein